MIDVLLKFASEAAARAVLTAHARASTWLDDHVIPDVRVWLNSQDVTGTDADGNPTVTHAPLSGFYLFVSLTSVPPALLNHPQVQLAFDRDRMSARQPGAVLASNVSAATLQDVRFAPVFAGADVPFGQIQ